MFLKTLWDKYLKTIKNLALFFVAFYQSFLSGTLGLGGGCRFYPTCSDYAIKAYQKFAFFKASMLVLKRLLKCHPLGPSPEQTYLKEMNLFYGTTNESKR